MNLYARDVNYDCNHLSLKYEFFLLKIKKYLENIYFD